MQEQDAALADIRDAIERVREDGNAVQFTLRNGIVLRCKPVPPIYVRTLSEQFIPPPPPMVHIDRGEDSFDEENRDDPRWKEEIAELTLRATKAIERLMFGLGTEPVSVPEGKYMPDDERWIAEVRRADKFTGVETPLDLDDPDMRYVSWLSFYALDNISDMELAGLLPQFLAGPSEVETAKVVDTFRDLYSRRTAADGAAADANSNGHLDNRASRRRRS